MDRQQQFLILVQTGILANAIRHATDPDHRDAIEFSSIAVTARMADAVFSSTQLPAGKDIQEAAVKWIGYFVNKEREHGEPWMFRR